jgi:hypothetical protein
LAKLIDGQLASTGLASAFERGDREERPEKW